MRNQLYAQSRLTDSWQDKDGDRWLVELRVVKTSKTESEQVKVAWVGWEGHAEQCSAATTQRKKNRMRKIMCTVTNMAMAMAMADSTKVLQRKSGTWPYGLE